MKILFQGDSITDCSRGNGLGQGYPLLIGAKLGLEAPGQYEFLNFGVGGNRVVDLYARIKKDGWNHCPDVFSILIGVNDVWHELSNTNGVDANRFYTVLKMLADDTIARLPNIRMIFMEPFTLNTGTTTENWEYFREETAVRGTIVKRVAEEVGGYFLPLQEKFNKASTKCGAAYWIYDGIHPSPAGHQLIADAWMDLFRVEILGK